MNKNPRSFFLLLWVVFTGFFAQGQMGSIPFTVKQPSFKRDSFFITKFGAKADGVTLNTASINNAITAASQRGGGVVVVPAGLWLTGPVVLQSNVNLHLQKGSLLQFTDDFSQYPLVEANWEGLPQMRNQSPLSATNAVNIAITGLGIIDGNGDAWRMVKKEKLTESQWKKLVASGGVLDEKQRIWYPSESSLKGSTLQNPGVIDGKKTREFYQSVKDFLRPNLLLFTACKTVLLEGVTFQNSPAWCVHPLMCEDLTVRNITVKNPWYAQNGDGLDVESCKNVLIEGSTFDVGDDGICIKSGRDEAGRKRGRPTENVIVRNNTVYHAHGGFVIGSEMSGGARNLYVDNNTFIGTDIGLRFKTTRGRGGVVENIYITNTYMKDIPGEAILFDMYYAAKDPVPLVGEKREPPKVEEKPVTEETPQFRNFYIKNVVVHGAEKAIFVRGLPEMNVQNIYMEDLVIQSKKGLDMTEATNIAIKNAHFLPTETDPVMNIHNSRNIVLEAVRYNKADLLLNVSGQKTENIQLNGTDLQKARHAVNTEFGATADDVRIAKGTSANYSYAQALANTAIKMWPDSFSLRANTPAKWSYDQGVILKGIEGIWYATGDKKWFDYIQKSMDHYVQEDGTIKGYRQDEYNIDHLNNGKVLLLLYQVTKKDKYRKAVENLFDQVKTHPRTNQGSFWHKKIYPYQVWLDGLYMGQPFYAEYAKLNCLDAAFNDITRQYVLIEKNARDPKTGLLYHGWDESREQQWANKQTGLSPHVWGRALGWFGMAMVDVLDYFPDNHRGRDSIIGILNRFAKAVSTVQDSKTGLWYDIPNMIGVGKNYPEASASAMLAYTLAKGVRKGYLPATYLTNARRAYDGILKEFIKEEEGKTNLHGTVMVSGLGGKPYRDGSFEYYMREPVIVNDPKGMGAFILAANEFEMLKTLPVAKGRTVMLDNYFNNEWRKDAAGHNVPWHYIWDEKDNDGYYTLGQVFERHGAKLKTLKSAPTAQNLKGTDVYIVVDPDDEKETARPNLITAKDANAVADWVKAGGVLVLLGNDSARNNIKSMNVLASKFGIRLNNDLFNTVEGNTFEQGAVDVSAASDIFPNAKKIYVKELATLSVIPPAKTIVTKEGKNIMAVAKHGRGTVFVLGDPWLYNEYTDGRKLPSDFQNYEAASDLVTWIAKQIKK
jgi:unsaturated rhamnogalacturonyl hydrolase